MKKLVTGLAWCLLVLLLLLSAGRWVFIALGWRLTLTKAWLYGLVLAGLSLGTLIAAILAEDRGNREREGKAREAAWEAVRAAAGPRVFYALLPASLLNGVFLLLQRSKPIIVLLILVTVFCCGVLSFMTRPSRALRFAALSLSGILSVPLVVLGIATVLFGGIAEIRTVRRLPSPDGSSYAEIIDDDQGALGGSTLVEVCPRGLSGEYGVRVAKQIYFGRWGEFKDMELSWKDESCLEINGRAYPIP